MNKTTIILLIVIFALVLTGALLIYSWTRDLSDAQAKTASFGPTIEDAGGVAPSSAFLLTFAGPVSSAAVSKALSVTPEIDFGAHQGSTRQEVLITPGAPLEEGQVYTFSLTAENSSYTWSVEIKKPLQVRETVPADRQTEVPTAGPIGLVLSAAVSVDLDALAEHMTFSPALRGTWSQEGRFLRFTPETSLSA